MTQARLELEDYTLRVLDVVKGKYGLKNRTEALNKFVRDYGGEIVEPQINEEVLVHFDNVVREHEEKYGKNWKGMTEKELDKLLGLDE